MKIVRKEDKKRIRRDNYLERAIGIYIHHPSIVYKDEYKDLWDVLNHIKLDDGKSAYDMELQDYVNWCLNRYELVLQKEARKKKLIEKYKRTPMNKFIQLDCWCGIQQEDWYIKPDKDGDWFCWTATEECMRTQGGIRILISRAIYDTKEGKENFIRLLEKAIEEVKETSDKFLSIDYWFKEENEEI